VRGVGYWRNHFADKALTVVAQPVGEALLLESKGIDETEEALGGRVVEERYCRLSALAWLMSER
jgi:hypothetical protein